MSYRYGCGYGVGAGPSRTPEVIWDARLDLLPLSTSSNAATLRAALAAMGLTLTRASSATVQTSASEVVTSGIGVDDPRVGRYGLVIEEARTNYNPNARSLATADGWTAGTVTYTANALASPDGTTSADREEVASGVFGRYRTILTATSSTTVSMWRRSGTAAVASHAWFILDGSNAASNQNDALGPTWERSALTIATPGGGVGPISTCDGRTLAAPFNLTAGARDVALDLIQVEVGKFATEAIITTGAAATRAAESLTLNDVGRILRNGRVSIECRYTPKHSTADMNAGGNMLFSQPGLFTRAYMDAAGAFIMRHQGAASITSSNTFTYSALDVLDVYFEIGGGVAPYAAIRKNGGARTVYVFPAGTYGNVVASTVPTLFSEGGSVAPCSAWVQRIRAYAPGRRPSWC